METAEAIEIARSEVKKMKQIEDGDKVALVAQVEKLLHLKQEQRLTTGLRRLSWGIKGFLTP